MLKDSPISVHLYDNSIVLPGFGLFEFEINASRRAEVSVILVLKGRKMAVFLRGFDYKGVKFCYSARLSEFTSTSVINIAKVLPH